MKMQVPFKSKFIPALLLLAIAMDAFSLIFFTRVDNVVHSDLYKYGLQFNLEWAGQYWTYSQLFIGTLAIATAVTLIATVSVLVYSRTMSTASRSVCILLLITGTVLSLFSGFILSSLDYIVHNDLYQYGLQFSYGWATPYWTYARLTLALIGISSAITVTSGTLTIFASRQTVDRTKLICSLLTAMAIVAIALSIIYTSSILAFIGLGLFFWGIILIYVRSEEYTKKALLDTTASSLLLTLNQIMQAMDFNQKALYLPPKYLKNPETNKAYIPKQKERKLPTPEQIQAQENQVFIKNPLGILIAPPGVELAKLFEKTLETNFARADLGYLQQNMPKLFIEDLEIAQSFEMKIENNRIQVKIENSPYMELSKEAEKLSSIYFSLGCPLSSAIACALTKATGKLIIIESQKTSEDGKSIEIEYGTIEEE